MNRRILVTRPDGQANGLAALLRDRGLTPVLVPTVAIDAGSSEAALDEMLAALDGADWLVITSASGAAALAARLDANEARLPEGLRVAAVGPATAGVLRERHIAVDHVPDAYRTVAIAAGLGDVQGRRVVLARADAATAALRHALLERGARVEEVVAYLTLEGPASSRDPLHTALHADLEGLAFTSSSTVRGLLRLASPLDRGRARAVPAFCIGPVTANTASQFGFDVAAVADDHTAHGLADAIALIACVIAVGVELFRLVHFPWLDAFRLTLPGALLLGRVFSVWNMVAYSVGIAIGVLLDRAMLHVTGRV